MFASTFHTGHANLVEYRIDHGADINVRDDYGRIPLHRAATDVIFSKFGHTIKGAKLMIFSDSGHLKVVEVLRGRGANLETKDNAEALDELNKKIAESKKKENKTAEQLAKETGDLYKNIIFYKKKSAIRFDSLDLETIVGLLSA